MAHDRTGRPVNRRLILTKEEQCELFEKGKALEDELKQTQTAFEELARKVSEHAKKRPAPPTYSPDDSTASSPNGSPNKSVLKK